MDEYPLRSRPRIKVISRFFGSFNEIIGKYTGTSQHNIFEVDHFSINFRDIMELHILDQNE